MANQTPVKIDPTTGLPARFSGSDALSESLIADEAILARVAADEAITGAWSFQIGKLTVGGVPVAGAAIVGITDYSAASNTLALGDALNLVRVNYATSCTLTVPPNSSVAFPLYTCIPIKQHGAGQLTLVAGAGVTLNTPWSLIARAQHSIFSVFQESTNVWTVAGDMW